MYDDEQEIDVHDVPLEDIKAVLDQVLEHLKLQLVRRRDWHGDAEYRIKVKNEP
jgi:hypothetical protein